MSQFLFDTNIFNKILDEKIDLSKLSNKDCYVTHVQSDEILATKNQNRRLMLEEIFLQVSSKQIPTESFVIGVSRLNKAKLGDGVRYGQLLQRLNQLNNAKPNNVKDALIAEAALANNIILVTEDRDLAKVMNEFGGSVFRMQDFLSA